MRGPIGDSWPMAFFDCPRGHRIPKETRVLQHGPDLPVRAFNQALILVKIV